MLLATGFGFLQETTNGFTRVFAWPRACNCCACHGAYADWVDVHGGLQVAKWRRLTRKQKEDWYGMKDLWDPIKRTQLCLSCHVGNVGQQKFVTHEMYAAGHPPLPSIEVATFSEGMPRHWETWKEKAERLTAMKKDIKEYYPTYEPETAKFEQSQLVLVGGTAALRGRSNWSPIRLRMRRTACSTWPCSTAMLATTS